MGTGNQSLPKFLIIRAAGWGLSPNDSLKGGIDASRSINLKKFHILHFPSNCCTHLQTRQQSMKMCISQIPPPLSTLDILKPKMKSHMLHRLSQPGAPTLIFKEQMFLVFCSHLPVPRMERRTDACLSHQGPGGGSGSSTPHSISALLPQYPHAHRKGRKSYELEGDTHVTLPLRVLRICPFTGLISPLYPPRVEIG